MKHQCPHCQAVLDFGDRAPSFCAFCGHSLGGSAPAAPAVTEAPPPDPNATTPSVPVSEAATSAPGPGVAGMSEGDPEIVGNYRLLRPIGGGGMGTVYEAEEIGSARRVALKLIASGFAGSKDAVERFRQEGRLASALVHPRCVFVYAADEEGGRPYIVMELMPGKTLDDLVREKGPLPIDEAVETIMDVIEGLQEAHHLGIIHRDVKPSNCFLEEKGRVKVGDFGLAKSLAASVRLTGTGAFLGTPLYASPEQIRAEQLTPQTDVYSVTATLYFLLAGKAPFESGDAVSTLARIVSDDPQPIRTLRLEVPDVLDAIISRGLERSRERRYADLEELRVALLPFLPGRSPFVGLGLRFGAGVIDHLLLWLIGMVIGIAGAIVGLSGFKDESVEMASPGPLVMQLVGFVVFLLYYLLEGFLGYSVGKGMLGLRVLGRATMAPPGLRRCLLRTCVFYLLLNGATLTGIFLIRTAPTGVFYLLLNSATMPRVPLLSTPVGIALVCCTMRTRNGLRGLHDFASGTRVIRLVRPRRRAHFRLPAPQLSSSQPTGLPSSIGPYRVEGALHWQSGCGTLFAREPGLGRDVLLWLRSGEEPALDSARRSLSRITRLRWLAAGRLDFAQWDAFLVPPGCTLPELVRSNGPLEWQDARLVLEQLTKELTLASEEQTVPALSAEQVWVQANGRIVILDPPAALDEPLKKEDEREPAPVLPLDEQVQRMSLNLLREVAALVVSGERGPVFPERTMRRSPLPVHAMSLLRRLADEEDGFRDVAEFQGELRETRSLPVEVKRARRAGQLAALAGLLFIGFGCCMMPAGFLRDAFLVGFHNRQLENRAQSLEEFEQAARADLAVRTLHPNPWARLAAVPLYADNLELGDRLRDRVKREKLESEARIEALNPILRHAIRVQMTEQARAEQSARSQNTQGRSFLLPSFRLHAERLLREKVDYQEQAARWTSVALLTWPTLWVLWAFAARGGLSYRIAGLVLVRRNGRPAARWQCAWRALLVWLPVTALLIASVCLDAWYWTAWQPDDPRRWMVVLSRLAWWAGVGLLGAFVVLALHSPGRAPNDRLAGTFVVPR